ncbi:unnamed protein product [Closterium sp. NIES-65]|nr:unnamed protein product [Closterium sp. NIES-65]
MILRALCALCRALHAKFSTSVLHSQYHHTPLFIISLDTVTNVTMNKATILELAKGFRGRAKNCIRAAKPRVEKALTYAYRDRRTKKRDMRGLAIERVNAGARQYGVRDSTGSVTVRGELLLSQAAIQALTTPSPSFSLRHFSLPLLLSNQPPVSHIPTPPPLLPAFPVPLPPPPPPIHPRYKQVRYSEMVHGMQQANVQLNRKVLSEIAASEPFTFRALVDLARQTLNIQRPQIPM